MNRTFDNHFKKGCRTALGIPGISLAASFFALGALFKNSGLNAMQSFLSTLIGFALPGQVVMAETLIVNGTLLNILIAVFLTNARLYPMTVNLVPVIRQKNRPRWHYYFLAHFIAVTSWVYMLSNYNKISKENRFSFFLGLGATLWVLSTIATVIGFYTAGIISKKVFVAIIFLNPIYFMCMIVSVLNKLHIILTVFLSIILAPILFLVTPDWSVLLAGVISGIVSYFFFIR
ncbi:MAG: branched-chain amino acid ABC transporter permease [Proteobacteria bacterium]|jgi:predicted branched-subunit amino acid permease|nr:branched-chain amino acid ABC transporter permease [Candidatus Fonsibacter sp. PEL4]NBZ97490.1 branched-chain amino acid ABC transporter permease [Candidatus Fonsibacter sp. PEL4]